MDIQFLGAAKQVTGSCYLLKAGGLRILIDCGLYQERSFLDRNWELNIDVETIDFVLLTHAHLDHSGRLPLLVKEGYDKPIWATEPTAELARIVLMDSAHLQEEDALFKRKRHAREGRQGPHPEVPLYTIEDAEKVFPLLNAASYGEKIKLSDRLEVCFHDAGHILGSSMVEIVANEDGGPQRFIFSGDIGQWNRPLVRDPSFFEEADYIVMESTYGDREHEQVGDVKDQLARIINDTVRRGGNVLVPVFAIERAQEFLYYLSELVREDRIPHLLFFLDSPMAVNATTVFQRHLDYLDDEIREKMETDEPPFRFPGLKMIQQTSDSKAINRIKGSCVIMAGSGMCTGGRIKHHLAKNISRPESTILFVGYQARETLGRDIQQGAREVRIHGEMLPVRARVEQIHGLSGHADHQTLLKWIDHFTKPPKCLFVTHGEEEVSESFAKEIRERTGWKVVVPEYKQKWHCV